MENRYFKVHYKLYGPMGKEKKIELLEETRPEMPFVFISGLGLVLKELENQLQDVKEGESFDITLTEEQAYGPYYEEGVQEVPVEAFFINGKMDEEHIYPGAVVPLMNDEGDKFNGIIVEVTDKVVVVDLNHPFAGKTLNFKGHVEVNRVATNQEIQDFVNSQGGCGGCGGNCGGDCGGDCGEGGCCGSCN